MLDTLQNGHYLGLRYILCGRESACYFVDSVEEKWLAKMRYYCHRLKPIHSLAETSDDRLFKFALNLSDDFVEPLMTDIRRLHEGAAAATSSGHVSVDLIVPGHHKANGLNILSQRWGVDHAQVLAFGDGGNDLEMLQQSGVSFAAPANNDAGVLQIIEKMLAGAPPFTTAGSA